jgi:hypothetical protein
MLIVYDAGKSGKIRVKDRIKIYKHDTTNRNIIYK